MAAMASSKLIVFPATAASPTTRSSVCSGVQITQPCAQLRQRRSKFSTKRNSRLCTVSRRRCVVASGRPAEATPVPVIQGRKVLDLFPEENVLASTGLSRAHAALRNDCAALILTLSKLDLTKNARYAGTLEKFIDQFVKFILMHHDVEDNVLFPALMQLPMAVPGVAADSLGHQQAGATVAAFNAATPFWADMVAEHNELLLHLKIVGGALAVFARAEESGAGMRERQVALDDLKEKVHAMIYDCVLPHLVKEEMIIPQIYRLRLTPEELAVVEQACAKEAARLAGPIGVAWIVHSIPEEGRDAFLSHIPPALADKVKNDLLPKLRTEYYQPLAKLVAGQ